MTHLMPDLGSGSCLVRERVGAVPELIDVVRAGRFTSDPGGHVLVVRRVSRFDIGAGYLNLRSQRTRVRDLLGRHLVRNDEDKAVPLHGCH